MQRVLVTGANGFLGSHIVRKALARGLEVRALCLPGTPTGHIEAPGVEIVRGDILDPAALKAPMRGVDAVFHTAGSTLEWSADPALPYRINALGTRNVCRAALEAGAKRLVHTSTAAAAGGARDGRSADEETLFDLWRTGPYSRSKLLAELEAVRAGARGLDVVVGCPHQILGAGDLGPSTPGRIVILFVQGKIPFYVRTRSQFVDVEDCAEGHLLAAEKGRRGERYLLAGPEAVEIAEFFAVLSEMTGVPAPRLAVPKGLVRLAAGPLEWVSDHLTHRPPLLTVGNGEMLYKDLVCSIEKARRELGFRPGNWRGALEKAVRWFRENGYFERRV